MNGDIAKTIKDFAGWAFGLRGEMVKQRRKRRDRIAEYFSSLAQTIEEANASLKEGIYPHGKCEELLVHAREMEAAIGNAVPKAKLKEYAGRVKEVHEIERLHADIESLSPEQRQRKRSLVVLDQAAGMFRGVAAHLRIAE